MPIYVLTWLFPLVFAALFGPLLAIAARRFFARLDAPPLRGLWITPLLFGLCAVVMRRYPTIVGVQGMVFTALLLLISILDARTQIIPDALVLLGAGLALALRLGGFAAGGLWAPLLGAVAGAGPLYVIHKISLKRGADALGLGDVKLMGMAGLYLGWPLIAVALLIGVVAGGVTAGALLLLKRKRLSDALPFGPMLCAGIWCAYVFGGILLRSYIGWLGNALS